MAVLNDHISQIHTQLVALAHKRRLLKMKVNHRHEPFIHRLPLEVSSNIMANYIDDVNSNFTTGHALKLSPALLLSSICATWRSVARSTPQIWTDIRIPTLRLGVPVILIRLCELIKELINLSGERALSIDLYEVCFQSHRALQDVVNKFRSCGELFRIIRAGARRWNEISLHGVPPEQMETIFVNTVTPNLKKLRILEPYRYLAPDHCFCEPGTVSLLASPQLEVKFTAATSLLRSVEINWDNITTVNISGISLSNAFEILLLAPQLKSYTILCEKFRPSKDGRLWLSLPLNLPLTHTTLKSLTFYSGSSDTVQFLQGVNFPSLQEFTFDAPTPRDLNSPVDHLRLFSLYSPSPLTSFSLSLVYGTCDEDILELLYLIPSLTHLNLEVPRTLWHGIRFMTDAFLQEFVKPSPSPSGPKVVAPRLEVFTYNGPLTFTWPAFIKIFDSSPTSIPYRNFLVEDCHKRPLREVSLLLRTEKSLLRMMYF